MFYTYIHRRASDNKPFYIGKGQGNRASSKLGRNAFWNRTVSKHGVKVEIAAPWQSEEEAFVHEKFLIKCFRDLGFQLANLTDGGEGGSGITPSAETKAKLSAKNKGRKMSVEFAQNLSRKLKGRSKSDEHKKKLAVVNRGKKWSDEQHRKFSETMRGRKQSPQHIAARASALTGKKMSPEVCAQMSINRSGGKSYFAKKVRCLETNQVFDAVSEAALWVVANGRSLARASHISACCRGIKKSAYGYTWEHFKEVPNEQGVTL